MEDAPAASRAQGRCVAPDGGDPLTGASGASASISPAAARPAPPSAPAAPVETMLEHCQRAGMAPSPSSIPGSATLSPSKLRQFPALLLGRASHPSVSSLFVVAFDSLIDDGGGDRSLITKRAIGCRRRGARKLEQDLVFCSLGSLMRDTRRRPLFGPVFCFVSRVPCSRSPFLIASDPRRHLKTPLEAIRGSLPPARVCVRTCLGRQLTNQDRSRRQIKE